MALQKRVYLDTACAGIYPKEVLEAANEFVGIVGDETMAPSDKTTFFREKLVETRQLAAQLFNCSPDEMALVENVTHALGVIANAVELTAESNVLVCDLEFQSSYLCFTQRQKKVGFEIRKVPHEGGVINAEIFRKYIDANTRLIVVSSVQEINGYRVDVAEIARLAHEFGALLIADGTQEAGAMKVDVKASDVDVYCTGMKKLLLNPFGGGFMYIRKELVDTLAPPYDGYFTVQMPSKYSNYVAYMENPDRSPFDDCPPVATAMKFEIGGYKNNLGAIGAGRAVRHLMGIGIENIEKTIIERNIQLTEGLARLGVTLCSPTDPAHMSPTVTFNLGLRDGKSEKEKELITYLNANNVIASLRCMIGLGGIRISMHYYTSREDIDAALFHIEEFLKNRRNGERDHA